MILNNSLGRAEFDKKHNYINQTPMMQQYLDVKFEHQDCFVLFRMGDFYELFFDDAKEAVKILSIVLAKRGKVEDEEIPMCGVPHHALDNYIKKFIEKGHKVAICDQLESPEEAKKRGGHKAVVRRDIVRIITQGTVYEDSLLNENRPNYLASIYVDTKNTSIGYIDITTGIFRVVSISFENLYSELNRINPKELLICDKIFKEIKTNEFISDFDNKLVFEPDQFFEISRCKKHIEEFYGIKSHSSIGEMNSANISVVGSLIQYIKITQKNNLPKIAFPKLESLSDYITLDNPTRKSLELIESSGSRNDSSLIHTIDNTLSASGGRLLYEYISSPLRDISKILERQSYTNFFFENINFTSQIREILKNMYDIERAHNKVLSRRCCPYDLLVIRNSLISVINLRDLFLKNSKLFENHDGIKNLYESIKFDHVILDLLLDSIKDDAPNNMSDGGFIKPSYHPRLEEIDNLINNSKVHIDKLKNLYQSTTGVENLKIAHNNLLGFYIEVSSKNALKLNSPDFIHKHTTSNTVRFVTSELKELENKMMNASSFGIALEHQIFEQVCMEIESYSEKIIRICSSLSVIDVHSSFAVYATENNYTKPEIVTEKILDVIKGRHPVVEKKLNREHVKFSVNDCFLDSKERFRLITGPNMGGKSTYLRQNALIIILAQIGSYVPASKAIIGVVDGIFSRIGSGDDLAGGKSTFMVEMIETASILNQATENSFVIFDEVGRGTSTYDGMSLAWAIVEYLHDNIKCNTLFATHYHELTELSNSLEFLKNYSVEVIENNGKIILTHNLVKGAADKSYGIHVAELAGIPKSVSRRANVLLKALEKERNKNSQISDKASLNNMNIFDNTEIYQERESKYKGIIEKLNNLNLDELSPKDAHNILNEIQNDIKEIK